MGAEATTNATSTGASASNAPAPAHVPSPGAVPRPGATTAPAAANPPTTAAPGTGANPGDPPAAAAPLEAAPAGDKKDVDLSTRFAALTKRERVIVERERALKPLEKDVSAWKQAQESAKLNPMALLEAHGLTYDAVTQFVLNDRKLTPEQRIEAIEAERAKERELAAKAQKDKDSEQVTSVIDGHKQAIREHVDQAGDTYELVRLNDAYDLVHTVVEEHFFEHGTILPVADAAKAVEDYLEGEARDKVLKSKKFAPKAETPPPPATPQAAAGGGDGPETRQPAPTLTHRAVSSAPPPAGADAHKDLSDEESKRRAAAMLRWNN